MAAAARTTRLQTETDVSCVLTHVNADPPDDEADPPHALLGSLAPAFFHPRVRPQLGPEGSDDCNAIGTVLRFRSSIFQKLLVNCSCCDQKFSTPLD